MRLIRWAADGTWEMIPAAVLAPADADGELGSDGFGGLHGRAGPPARCRSTRKGSAGLSTKVHLAAEGHARPRAFTITAGRASMPRLETAIVAQRPVRLEVPRHAVLLDVLLPYPAPVAAETPRRALTALHQGDTDRHQ